MSILWILILFSAIPSVTKAESRCSGNQITWIHRTSGKVIGCSPCPACPPGSEYSIPCSTKAVNGTPAKCVSCPPGKFSSKFDNKPCVACTRCSKRYTKKICTPHWNAVCGGCIAGYHENKVTFSCDECAKCCFDGKDKAPLGCARVRMCKTRPYGCPTTPTTKSTVKQSNASQIFTFKTKRLQKQHVTKAKTTANPNKQFLTKTAEDKRSLTPEATRQDHSSTNEGSSKSILLYVMSSLFIVALLILLVAAVKCYKFYENGKIRRPDFGRSLSSSYTTSPQFAPVPTPEDRTLEDFVENGHDAVESVCVLLADKKRKGMWDFERVALRFALDQVERIGISRQASIDGGNPTRELLEVLCSKRPKITVKQFAEIIKIIKRNDVYEKLRPFFS